MNITQIDQFDFKKLKINDAQSRWSSASDVIPFVDGMDALIVLNEANLNGEVIHSLQELRNQTGAHDLQAITKNAVLLEESKNLPIGLARGLKNLCTGNDIIIVQRDHGRDDTAFWKIDNVSYLDGDLIEVFKDPFGAFWIVPSNESWLIHTADDGPWIYAVLPPHTASEFLTNSPDITERIDRDFPYLR